MENWRRSREPTRPRERERDKEIDKQTHRNTERERAQAGVSKRIRGLE